MASHREHRVGYQRHYGGGGRRDISVKKAEAVLRDEVLPATEQLARHKRATFKGADGDVPLVLLEYEPGGGQGKEDSMSHMKGAKKRKREAELEGGEETTYYQRNKVKIAANYKRDKVQIATKKETALKAHGCHYEGSGLTASNSGRYVARKQGAGKIEATCKSSAHVAALVFNLFSGGPEHKLNFEDLQLDQVELESEAQLVYDNLMKKMRAKAAKKARK
jgi:hypothetical protein